MVSVYRLIGMKTDASIRMTVVSTALLVTTSPLKTRPRCYRAFSCDVITFGDWKKNEKLLLCEILWQFLANGKICF